MRPDQLFQILLTLTKAASGFVAHFFDQFRSRVEGELAMGEPERRYAICAFERPLDDHPQYIHGGTVVRGGEPFVIYLPEGWYWLYALEVADEGSEQEQLRSAQITLYQNPKAGAEVPGNPYTAARPRSVETKVDE